MKKQQLLLFLICAVFAPAFVLAQTAPQGFYLDNWMPKSIEIPAFDSVSQTTQPATVTVTIDAGKTISKVPLSVYGHNAAAWGGKLDQNAQVVKDITNLAPQVIRWPGGSMSDNYMWKATSRATCPKDLPPTYSYVDLHYGSNNSSWTMSVDNYYSLLAKTNSAGVITVNYGYARYGTGPDPARTAAKYAADWVRYDNGRTKYWEIGNECFGSWESGYKIDKALNQDGQPEIVTGDLYGRHCKIFIEEMRKAAKEVGNDIKIGVVAMDSHVTWDVTQRDWNKGMMPHIADIADFIVVHSYYTPYNQNSNAATILNSAANTKNMVQYIADGLKTHAKHEPMPMALTEWNIFATGSAQQVSYINGMQAAMVLGELIKTGFGLGNRWDFVNGWSDGDNHGLFADGDPGITARYTPRAPFFYMYYFQKFFGDKMLQSTVSGSSAVVCYASKFYTGQSGIVLVNKGTTEQVVNISLDNFNKGERYYYHILTGGDDNGDFSRKVYVNEKTTTLAGGGPADYATLKPYGTTIDGEIKFTLPKYSTVYLLVENDTTLISQTIQFDSIPQKAVGDTSFAVTASASSGLTVQFASSNPKVATVNNGEVKIIGAGTCDIIAFQEGDSIYNPASQVIHKLTVVKGNQAITFPELEPKTTGDVDFNPGAVASSGLACTYVSSNPAVATIVNGQVHIKAAGTALITAKQSGNVNYNAASDVSQELVVTPATAAQHLVFQNDFQVFPNPSTDVVTIRFNTMNPGLVIYNSTGAVIYKNNTPEKEVKIQVSQLGEAGIYFINANGRTEKFAVVN
jgi:hypothetical protein